jgi:hypothetical protein
MMVKSGLLKPTEHGANMGYQVVVEDNEATLSQLVSKLIQQGWTPLGGVAFTSIQNTYRFAQAMVK